MTGLNQLTPTDIQAIKEALLAQNVTKPAGLAELVGERGVLRGNPVASQSFKLLSRARVITANDRLTFKWESALGATSYRVYIGAADSRKVADSGELTSSVTEWTQARRCRVGNIHLSGYRNDQR